MNGYREDNPCCFSHPKEFFVGVCPLCLHERLLVLAAKQGHRHHQLPSHRSQDVTNRKLVPKIFAFGSFLNRLEFRHWKSDNSDLDHASNSSQEDSFISIKFENNGVASWEKSTVPKVSLEHCSKSWNHHNLNKEININTNNKDTTTTTTTNMSVIEHTKPRAPLRWRKRIGHLFHLMRWKRSNYKGNVCHVGTKVEGVKVVRKGWIKTLTKRRTKEE